MMESILLVCDNRDSRNWGCRSTSIALGQILSAKGTLTTTSKFVASRKHPVGSFSSFMQRNNDASRILERSLDFNIIHSFYRFIGGYDDYIENDPRTSVERFLKASKTDTDLNLIKQKFEESDKIVINGEGSLIFRTPPRRDLNFQLFAVELAHQLSKQVYYINAMASECPKTKADKAVQEAVVKTLSKCKVVANRDPVSANILTDLGLSGVKWYPDALFSWYSRYKDFLQKADLERQPALFDAWPESDLFFNDWKNWPENYICISGASRPPGVNPKDWVGFYIKITNKIKSKLGIEVVLVNPSADDFLKEVAIKTKSIYIRPTINILIAAYILGKAKAYLSGRFHPSILASLNGTPCTFLVSNSHKTYSLQKVLGNDEPIVFSFSEGENNLLSIIEELRNSLDDDQQERSRIMKIVENRAKEATEGIIESVFNS